jgi:hypothetical protein
VKRRVGSTESGLGDLAKREGYVERQVRGWADRWQRAKTEEFLRDTRGLRDHAVDSPVGTKWDAYEFILLIGAHSERHTKQIQEVKADPNFPKS